MLNLNKIKLLVAENGSKTISEYLSKKFSDRLKAIPNILVASDEEEMYRILENERISLLIIDGGPMEKFISQLKGKKAGGKRLIFILSREKSDFRCCSRDFDSSEVVSEDSPESFKVVFDKVIEALLRGCGCAA